MHVVARNDVADLARAGRLIDAGAVAVHVTESHPLADLALVHLTRKLADGSSGRRRSTFDRWPNGTGRCSFGCCSGSPPMSGSVRRSQLPG